MLELDGIILNVQEHTIAPTQAFRINFSDRRQALNITKANTRISKTWVSVLHGRQKEAEMLGSLIAEFFKNKK